MKSKDIKEGGVYAVKVSHRMRAVTVNHVSKRWDTTGRERTVFHCTNLSTGRRIRVYSPQRFRYAVEAGRLEQIVKSLESRTVTSRSDAAKADRYRAAIVRLQRAQ